MEKDDLAQTLIAPDPQKEIKDTKNHIAEVATHLFAHQGYDGTSIRDIVEGAGVTKPVLYYYFKNKEELYHWIIKDAYEFFLEKIRSILSENKSFLDTFKNLIRTYIECCLEYEDTTRLIFGAAFGPTRSISPSLVCEYERKHLTLLNSFMQSGIEQGYIRKITLQEAIMHFVGSINIYIMNQLVLGDELPEQLEDKLMQNVLYGIGGALNE